MPTSAGTHLEELVAAEPYLESATRIAVPVRLTAVEPDGSRAVIAGTLAVAQSGGALTIVDSQLVTLPPPPPDAPPACRALDLSGSVVYQGATGSMAGSLILTSNGGADCSLQGQPQLRFLDAGNQLLPTDEGPFPDQRNPNRLIDLAPGRRALARFVWSNWCPAGTAAASVAPGESPATVLVILPGSGDALRVPIDQGPAAGGVPRCDDPAQPAQLAVATFDPFQEER